MGLLSHLWVIFVCTVTSYIPEISVFFKIFEIPVHFWLFWFRFLLNFWTSKPGWSQNPCFILGQFRTRNPERPGKPKGQKFLANALPYLPVTNLICFSLYFMGLKLCLLQWVFGLSKRF